MSYLCDLFNPSLHTTRIVNRLGAKMPEFRSTEPEYWQRPGPFTLDLGVRMAVFVVGEDEDENAPAAVVLELEPGQFISHHAHECYRFEVVVKGSIYSHDQVFVAGDVMTSKPGEFYGPNVAGPDGCTVVEVLSRASDSVSPVYLMPDGSSRRCDVRVAPPPIDRLSMDDGLADRVAEVLAETARKNAHVS